MSDEPTKTRPRIRTYAGDLAEAKARQPVANQPATVKSNNAEHHPEVLQRAAASKVFPNVSSTKETSAPRKETLKEPVTIIPERGSFERVPNSATKTPPIVKRAPIRTEIPVYHELQKEVQKTSTKLSSELANATNKNKAIRTNIGYDATVITDTQSGRFQLFSAVASSIKDWFKKLTIKKTKTPTYTVPDASRRKGVVQKATTKTGTIFTADNKTLRDQIRLRQAENKHKETALPDWDEDISWSPYTESVFALIEPPEDTRPVKTISNVTFEFKKKVIPTKAQAEVVATAPVTTPVEARNIGSIPRPIVTISPTKSTPPLATTTAPVQPEVNTLSSDPSSTDLSLASVPPQTNINYTESESPASTFYPPTKPIGDPLSTNLIDLVDFGPENEPEELERGPIALSTLWRLKTNSMLMVIVGGLLVIGLFVLAILAIFNHLNSSSVPPDTIATEPINTLGETTLYKLTINPETTNQASLISEIQAVAGEVGVEVVLLYSSGEEVKPEYIFKTLGLRILPSLVQAFDTVRFIPSENTPILRLGFTDKSIVLGGMLDWENRIVEDLSTLYHLQPGPVVFTDEQAGTIDVRVARVDGSIQLLYGFADENTLIIAPSFDKFTRAASMRPTTK